MHRPVLLLCILSLAGCSNEPAALAPPTTIKQPLVNVTAADLVGTYRVDYSVPPGDSRATKGADLARDWVLTLKVDNGFTMSEVELEGRYEVEGGASLVLTADKLRGESFASLEKMYAQQKKDAAGLDSFKVMRFKISDRGTRLSNDSGLRFVRE